MKVGVRLNGGAFRRAEALVADVRRRAIAQVKDRIEAEAETERRERDQPRLGRR